MTLHVLLSLAITAAAVLAVAGVRWYRLDRKRTPRAEVPGVDVVCKTFIALNRRPDKALTAAIAWMALSLAIGLGGPLIFGRAAYVLDPTQAFAAINYLLLVPCLAGAYVELTKSIGHFPAVAMAKSRPIGARRRTLRPDLPWLSPGQIAWQALLLLLALVIQYFGIYSEIDRPSPCSPWVEPATFQHVARHCSLATASDLSWDGVVYYALRGLDGYLGLGLASVIVGTWLKRRQLFGRHTLVDFAFPGLGPTASVTNVGGSLLLCILFGSMIMASQGLSLWAHAVRLDSSTARVALFTESTWPVWAMITIVVSVMAAALVMWLRERITEQTRHLEDAVMSQYAVSGGFLDHQPADLIEAKLHADFIQQALAIRVKVAEVFDKASTWPLPVGAAPAVAISVTGQLVNLGVGFYTVLHHTG
jgi:hypothetical protein